MLSAIEKERLKNMLPYNYGKVITEKLHEKNILQSNGKPFKLQYVKLWFKDKMKNIILDKHVQEIVKELNLTTKA